MADTPETTDAVEAVDAGSADRVVNIDKRMREATGVYDYDNTMRPMSATQRRTSDGATFKPPAIKPITPPGGRTFI